MLERILILASMVVIPLSCFEYDLTMLGQVKYRGSVDRFPIAFARLFKDELRINHIPTPGWYDFTDVEKEIVSIIDNPDKSAGRVALFFGELSTYKDGVIADLVPQESQIKIAYSLLESSALPKSWVNILNNKFDLAIVADEYYVGIHKVCGVTIPVYVQPHGVYLEDFLVREVREQTGAPFIFGMTGAFWERKNQDLLIRAFIEEFGDDPQVKLKIHGRPFRTKSYLNKVKKIIKKSGCHNIELLHEALPENEFIDFMYSLDCYVLLSKGEGFSITPREALALGIPTVISDNTAHGTLCNTGFVYSVPSTIKKKVGKHGYRFESTLEDARKALREVYENYGTYKEKAKEGREWVKSFLWPKVKLRFSNFFKPKLVILGNENRVTDEYIMTSSSELYKKYSSLTAKEGK